MMRADGAYPHITCIDITATHRLVIQCYLQTRSAHLGHNAPGLYSSTQGT